MQVGKACVIPICEGKKFNLVHKFPANLERFIEWKDAIEKEAPIEKLKGKTHTDIRKSSFICSRHFALSCYKNVESRNLNQTALPHLNLSNLNDYKKSKAFQLAKSRPSQPTTVLKSSIVVLSNVVLSSAKNEIPPKPFIEEEEDVQEPEITVVAMEEIIDPVSPPSSLPLPTSPSPSKNVIEDKINEQEIEVRLKDKPYKIDNFWLRDHCRCDFCYDHKTFQRKIDILTISDEVMPREFQVQGESKLFVEWDDDHKSVYDVDFLIKNFNDDEIEIELSKNAQIVLWTKEIIEAKFEQNFRVSMRDYMSDPEIAKCVLKNLQLYGVAFVDGVQPNQQSTEFVIRQLFFIHKTFFGEMWTFSDENQDHHDTAYTNNYLAAHNDNTYFKTDSAGLQVLHCIVDGCVGGENFLIDGFQVAHKLKISHPDVFDRLTTTNVEAEYIEQGRHHKYAAPIIKLDPLTGNVMQIRYNNADRGSLRVKNVRQFYGDLKILAAEMERDENRVVFKLQPGTVMIFDNWRVLHGRMSYKGQRRITGCYVSRDEYESALRTNGFIN